MHRAAEERVRFFCGRCGRGLDTEGAKVNHKRTCTGGGRTGVGGSARIVGFELRWRIAITLGMLVDMCGGEEMVGGVGRRKASAANFTRHQDRCRVWDPGGGRGLDLAEGPWVDGMLRGRPITAPRC